MKDPVGIVEAAYGLEGTEEEWLRALVKAMEPSSTGGVGGFFFDRSATEGQWVWGAVGRGPAEAMIAGLPVLYEGLSPERRTRLLSAPPVLTVGESLRVLDDGVLQSFGHD